MDMVVVIIIVGAIIAGFVQGLSGFGFGMTAMAIWAWVLDPQLAAVLSVFGALTGQVIAAVTVRRGFDMKRLLPFVVGGLVGIPIGVTLLPMLDPVIFKVFLGAFLVTWCPAMLMIARLPHIKRGGRVADGAAGALGGIMGGIGGFTGVIPTLWCTLRGYDRDTQRSIIQNFNLSMLAVTMTTYLASGIVTRQMWPLFAIVAPAMLIPSLLGSRVYIGISDVAFKRVVLGLLTASGMALLVSALPQLLTRG
jgi:uncharacterized membrane protein YfcA